MRSGANESQKRLTARQIQNHKTPGMDRMHNTVMRAGGDGETLAAVEIECRDSVHIRLTCSRKSACRMVLIHPFKLMNS